MTRPILLIGLLLNLLPAAFAADEAAREFAGLRREYSDLRKKTTWPDVRRRRDVVVRIGDSASDRAKDVLLEIFMQDTEQTCRVPALMALGRRGDLKHLKAAVKTAIRDRNDVWVMLLPLALAGNRDPEFGPWLTGNLLGTKNRTVRTAVVMTLGVRREPSAYEPLLKVLDEEGDTRILYEALIATARIGGARSIPRLSKFLEHENEFIREGAITALVETGEREALPFVLARSKDPFPRAREAVALAIRKFRAMEGVPVLIEMLRTGPLRVIETARSVLEDLTGEKHGFDAEAWKAWWEKHKDGQKPPAQLPDDVGSAPTYYGMKILSDRVLFLVDMSGSMKTGRPPRIETARKELSQALDQLNPKAKFNVVGFSGSPVWWNDSERKATPPAVADAKKFVDRLSVGGETNIYDTMVEALERNRLADTIYLLGDGCPSSGKVTEHDEIVIRIRWMNRMRKVRINTIALVRRPPTLIRGPVAPAKKREDDEQEAAILLSRIATTSGGTFLRIDS
jgi:hypothetical protein